MVQQNPSFLDIAISKKLPEPDESGLILTKHESFLKAAKVGSPDQAEPTEEEMEIINSSALWPQKSMKYMMIRGANPIGIGSERDVQGDEFSKKAEKTMAAQGVPLPLLVDHNHDLLAAMPVGFCIKSYMTSKGLREDYALPIEDYNADIRAALINGSVQRISVGILVKPEDRLCSSCKTKSIYSYSCNHKPGQKDENGNLVSVIISDVYRYIERSLCNVPARLGTGLKSFSDPMFEGGALLSEVKSLGYPEFCQSSEEFDIMNYMINNPSLYKELPLTQMRTEMVQATQTGLDADKLQSFIDGANFDGGFVANRSGSLYMLDGHHRLEAAKASDRTTIWAHTLSLPDTVVGPKYIAEQMGMNPQVFMDSMKSADNPDNPFTPIVTIQNSPPTVVKTDLSGLEVNQNLTAATISTVNTIEDSIVADEKAEKTAEATEEVTKAVATDEKAVDEASKTEEATKASEDDECMKGKKPPADEPDEDDAKTASVEEKALDPIKVEASLSADSDLVIKNLIASTQEQTLQLNKALDAFKVQEANVAKQLEVMAEQSKTIDKLCELQKELATAVTDAAKISSDELTEKVARLLNQNQAAQVENKNAQQGDVLFDLFPSLKAANTK